MISMRDGIVLLGDAFVSPDPTMPPDQSAACSGDDLDGDDLDGDDLDGDDLDGDDLDGDDLND